MGNENKVVLKQKIVIPFINDRLRMQTQDRPLFFIGCLIQDAKFLKEKHENVIYHK